MATKHLINISKLLTIIHDECNVYQLKKINSSFKHCIFTLQASLLPSLDLQARCFWDHQLVYTLRLQLMIRVMIGQGLRNPLNSIERQGKQKFQLLYLDDMVNSYDLKLYVKFNQSFTS